MLTSMQRFSLSIATAPDGDYKSLAATNDLDHERVLGVLLSGWSPDLAAVLWRRVVGLLGNPNRFKSAVLHEAAFKCLTRVWEDLLKVLVWLCLFAFAVF